MTWEYISGFFDADGSISLISPGGNKYKTLYVTFHNNELNILKEINLFIYNCLGFNGTFSHKNSKKENHSDSYDLRYRYRHAVEVCNKLQIYHPKKVHRVNIYNQIQTKIKRNGRYTEEELREIESLYQQFSNN